MSPAIPPSKNKNIIIPAELPQEVVRVFEQTFHASQFEKAFQKILKDMGHDDVTPVESADAFLDNYEKQVRRLRPEEIDTYPHAFRAGIAYMMLKILPRFRMEFAEKGYNYLFLDTHLKKRVLCEIQGISLEDINMRIRLDGLRPKVYLEDQIQHLVPETFLANY